MPDDSRRRIRAVLRNAVTWGIAWGVVGGSISAAVALVNPGPGADAPSARLAFAVFSAIKYGTRFAVVGSVIGTAFAAIVRFGYHGRRLSEINPIRFGALGAAVGAIGVPLFLQTMNVLSGDGPVAWDQVLDDSVWAGVFGAAAAAGSILLARRGHTRTHESAPNAAVSGAQSDALPPPQQEQIPLARRAESMPR